MKSYNKQYSQKMFSEKIKYIRINGMCKYKTGFTVLNPRRHDPHIKILYTNTSQTHQVVDKNHVAYLLRLS